MINKMFYFTLTSKKQNLGSHILLPSQLHSVTSTFLLILYLAMLEELI